jgi:hypothetical protein
MNFLSLVCVLVIIKASLYECLSPCGKSEREQPPMQEKLCKKVYSFAQVWRSRESIENTHEKKGGEGTTKVCKRVSPFAHLHHDQAKYFFDLFADSTLAF